MIITARAPSLSFMLVRFLLIAHDGLIHFLERPLDHRFRQSVPLQYLIIDHQHFELCERCLPKVLHLGRWLIQDRLALDPKKAHPRISATSGMPNAMVAHISSFAHGTSAWDLISL